MATSQRSLRVGVLIGDQLVEERLFDGATIAGGVTFGQSLRCTLSVPLDGVPREHVLFTAEHGKFVLHATPAMQVTRTDQRGRISVGDATILFQEIATPPKAPRLQLPAAIRGTLADRIDRRLAAIVGGSVVVHIAIAAVAWMNDVDVQTFGLPPVAQTYHQDELVVSFPDETPVTPTTEPGTAVPSSPKQTPRPIVRPTQITRPASGDDAQRLASILTGDQASEDGTGGMRPRQAGADLNKQIDEARNRKITIGDGTQTSRTDDRARIDDRHGPLVDDPTLTRTPPPKQEQPKDRIVIGPIKPDSSTTLTPALVLDRINTVYMAGLQRCYRFGLADDSKLSGRVAISFTVDDRGRVIDPDASGLTSVVDACISKLMTTWRFPIPKDKDGDPTDASFAVSLALQPS